MWNKTVNGPTVFLYLAGGTLVSCAIGLLLQIKILLPLLNVAFAYPVLFTLVADGKRNRAIGTMLFWALCLTIVMIAATVQFHGRAEMSVINGKDYANEMLRWVRTGDTRENHPSQFAPQHLLHFCLFAILSTATGGLASLFMGAILMNYMSFYVGTLVLAAQHPIAIALLGWQPYAIVRVISYVMIGIVLGEPLISRLMKRSYDFARKIFLVALCGIVLDIVIKSLIAPAWGLMLRSFCNCG